MGTGLASRGKWRLAGLNTAQGGWEAALQLGHRRGGEEGPPGAADHMREGGLPLRAAAKGLCG